VTSVAKNDSPSWCGTTRTWNQRSASTTYLVKPPGSPVAAARRTSSAYPAVASLGHTSHKGRPSASAAGPTKISAFRLA
jgi:hypothetical protein